MQRSGLNVSTAASMYGRQSLSMWPSPDAPILQPEAVDRHPDAADLEHDVRRRATSRRLCRQSSKIAARAAGVACRHRSAEVVDQKVRSGTASSVDESAVEVVQPHVVGQIATGDFAEPGAVTVIEQHVGDGDPTRMGGRIAIVEPDDVEAHATEATCPGSICPSSVRAASAGFMRSAQPTMPAATRVADGPTPDGVGDDEFGLAHRSQRDITVDTERRHALHEDGRRDVVAPGQAIRHRRRSYGSNSPTARGGDAGRRSAGPARG